MLSITNQMYVAIAILLISQTALSKEQPKLSLTQPNGGETLVVGSTAIIEWEGIAPTDPISIEYSINNGADWTHIADNVTGLQYPWKVPNTVSSQCLMRIKNVTQFGVPVLSFKAHSAWINGASYSRDGQRFTTASDDHTARVWNLSGQLQSTLNGHSDDVWWASFHPGGGRIVTASADHTARIWDATTGQLLRTLSDHSRGVQYADFSPDGNQVVTASEDGTVKIWNTQTGTLIRTLFGHSNGVYGATYSPDGQLIATASRDWTIKIWNSQTGELVRTLIGHNDEVHSVRFSPDGGRLVTGGRDNVAKVWQVESGYTILTLHGHVNWVWRVAFSPDASIIATAGRDGTAKLWNAATGQLLQTLSGHTADVGAAEFNTDGTKLLTAANDQMAKIWNIAPASDLDEIDQSDAPWSIFSVSTVPLQWRQHRELSVDQNYPNPVSHITTIGYTVNYRGPVEIVIVDVLGKAVASFEAQSQESGYHKVAINVSYLPTGVYSYIVKTAHDQLSRKMFVN